MTRFHDHAAADKALADFEARFKQGEVPEDMRSARSDRGEPMHFLPQILKHVDLTASTSEALRMIEQGGVQARWREGQRQGIEC